MKQPVDESRNPLPLLSFPEGQAHQISASGTTARNTTAFETYGDTPDEDATHRVITVFCATGFHFKTGGSGVEAATTDHYVPGGIMVDIPMPISHTHIAVILASGTDTVYVSERD